MLHMFHCLKYIEKNIDGNCLIQVQVLSDDIFTFTIYLVNFNYNFQYGFSKNELCSECNQNLMDNVISKTNEKIKYLKDKHHNECNF